MPPYAAVQTGDPTGTGKGGDSVYKFLYGDQARFFDDGRVDTLFTTTLLLCVKNTD